MVRHASCDRGQQRVVAACIEQPKETRAWTLDTGEAIMLHRRWSREMLQIHAVGQQMHGLAAGLQGLKKASRAGDQHIGSGYQALFHVSNALVLEARPTTEIINTVINHPPRPDRLHVVACIRDGCDHYRFSKAKRASRVS